MTDPPLIDIYFRAGRFTHLTAFIVVLLSLTLIASTIEKKRAQKIILGPCIVYALSSFLLLQFQIVEICSAYFTSAKYEMEAFKLRLMGPYWYIYVLTWTSLFVPTLMLFKYFRKPIWTVFILSTIGLGGFYWETLLHDLTTMSRIP